MLYSKTSGYALRALGYLAAIKSREAVGVSDMAKACRISPAYLAKIFQVLTKAGLVGSKRGMGGGFYFLKQPSDISLLSVIQLTDDHKNSPMNSCVMGLAECSDKNPCDMHGEWMRLTKKAELRFRNLTIQDLAKRMSHDNQFRDKRIMLSKHMKAVFSE